ncbi:hypothetical protein [Albibacterium profundi]|uniref:Glycosyltransferase subfamily 4-like N-terminal domain-containing protein n=1 Tax=Albibacterium profundi TaxID=3134906 RepID=A0ABV5C9R3_9SPHI
MSKQLLIMGKLPPPIGGVTIHVSRLLIILRSQDVDCQFYKLTILTLLGLPMTLIGYKCIHIHSSNPFVRLYSAVICKITNTKSIITFHGNIGRYGPGFKNSIDKLTIWLASKPIVLNANSFNVAKKINANSELISAFIPPKVESEILCEKIFQKIKLMKLNHNLLFSTNAYNMTFDSNGAETYGIVEIIEIFRMRPEYGLVVSDPSSAYSKYFAAKKNNIPSNILIISEEHSFYKVMELCDVTIRNTTTDGDSLSVKESLYLNKTTLATDVVKRPNGCVTYELGKLDNVINRINENIRTIIPEVENGADRLISLYKVLTC